MKQALIFSLLALSFWGCKKGGGDDTGGGNNNPPDPTVRIEDLSLFEGNAVTNQFGVSVKLSAASTKVVTVKYSTANGWAKAGEDYTAALDQTLTFQPGEVQKNISLTITADDIKEGEDDLKVQLSAPANATLGQASATVTIRNDDTKVAFTNTGYDAPTTYPGYALTWADEFNSGSLDLSAWSFQNGDGCPGVCGWGNNELEYYTDRPDNLFFQDGKLIIEGKKENYNNRGYTSSKILTAGKKVFKFARIDIRAKLPKGKGIWPAFWMLPQSNVFGGWPTSGEIDIMEMVGHEPNRTVGTVHYGPGPGSTQISRNTTISTGTLNEEFHVYSIEWKQDEMNWYLDGNLFSTVTKADVQAGMTYPFNEDFFLIFNLAIGGNWPGSPDATTYLPQWLIVDYIRVYQ